MLICGDRNWTDSNPIRGFLETLDPSKDTIIHGAARGADSIAGDEAKAMGFKVLAFPANWRKFGTGAGPVRNREMIAKGYPDTVVAFHDDINQSKGTADMLELARKIKLPTMLVTHDEVEKNGGVSERAPRGES